MDADQGCERLLNQPLSSVAGIQTHTHLFIDHRKYHTSFHDYSMLGREGSQPLAGLQYILGRYMAHQVD